MLDKKEYQRKKKEFQEKKKAYMKKVKKVEKFINEFKEFALRGNVIDLAVGVIIGGAFQGIIKSLVENVLTPFLAIFGKTEFNALSIKVFNATIKYGMFITEVINFIIMAFVVFVLVKLINRLGKITKPAEEKPAEPTEKECPYCLSKIPLKATRCAHCTSVLLDKKGVQDEAGNNS